MEHRMGRRIATRMPVGLWVDDSWFGNHNVTNIGNGGLFLSGSFPSLAEGQIVSITEHFDESENLESVRERASTAMVIHKESGGVGLMWVEYELAAGQKKYEPDYWQTSLITSLIVQGYLSQAAI